MSASDPNRITGPFQHSGARWYDARVRVGAAMKRREFITLVGGAAAAWPLVARAQQPEQVRRIGVLIPLAADDTEGKARLAAFLQGLQQLSWADGRNVRIDTRWAGAKAD